VSGQSDGGRDPADQFVPQVYDELRALAARELRRERPGHTLQPTALVNEAYLRLAGEKQVDWKGRSHFLAIAARDIRQILINHAQARGAAKRGGGAARVSLLTAGLIDDRPEVELLDLDAALRDLHDLDERQARVVELRFFGGLDVEEAAEVLGVSPRTVKSDWRFARAWLHARLQGHAP
jgi:RNA polymerase sigma factor (TIGR02999 family)